MARPSEKELAEVRHHFIASHSIREEVTAVDFEKFALAKTRELHRDHDTVIMTGGTGLYIKAFCEGLDEIPAIEPAVREKITGQYEQRGLEWLQEEIRQKDPLFYATGEIRNPHRVLRALEVMESTGKSILEFRKGVKASRPFRVLKTGIDMAKADLHRNIDARVEEMMRRGLAGEVKALMPYRELPALQTVGYAELFDYFDGKTTLDEAVALIRTHTRQYAKRQLTWFRKDPDIAWFSPGTTDAIISWAGAAGS